MHLAARYVLLAIVAIAANIGSQALSIELYSGPYSMPASILVGTGVGLLLKYVLDKRYIFRFEVRDLRHDTYVFTQYATTGVLTTVAFWALELGFNEMFGTAAMRYLGGLCGLAAGYFLKYHLDKRYVFATERTS